MDYHQKPGVVFFWILVTAVVGGVVVLFTTPLGQALVNNFGLNTQKLEVTVDGPTPGEIIDKSLGIEKKEKRDPAVDKAIFEILKKVNEDRDKALASPP